MSGQDQVTRFATDHNEASVMPMPFGPIGLPQSWNIPQAPDTPRSNVGHAHTSPTSVGVHVQGGQYEYHHRQFVHTRARIRQHRPTPHHIHSAPHDLQHTSHSGHHHSGPSKRPHGPQQPVGHGLASSQEHHHHQSAQPQDNHPHTFQQQSHVAQPQRPQAHSPLPRPHAHQTNSTHAPISNIQELQHGDFQYSRCTGTKKALCIGINYTGQERPLNGCVNDAKRTYHFLRDNWGFQSKDMVMLRDDTQSVHQLPTKMNILNAMRWLVKDARTHDSLFLHYSGHGGQVPDKDGDEVDGMDEVIFPLDYRKEDIITDDEMHEILIKPLPRGCRLTVLFDSCHSGSVLDLPFLYHSNGRVKTSQVTARFRRLRSSPADVISFSGCKDSQTSADTVEDGIAVGAMSYAFMLALRRHPKQSYASLLKSVREILSKRYSQKPQLSASHRIDTHLDFIL